MTISSKNKIEWADVLSAWGRWRRGGLSPRVLQSVHPLARLMSGVVAGKPCSVALPVAFAWLPCDDAVIDAFMLRVDRAVAALPQRRKEALIVAFCVSPSTPQSFQATLMSPKCSQSVFSRHLNLALKQLDAVNDIRVLLKGVVKSA